jgi:hypothetical protein
MNEREFDLSFYLNDFSNKGKVVFKSKFKLILN